MSDVKENEDFVVLRAAIGARMEAGMRAQGIAQALWSDGWRQNAAPLNTAKLIEALEPFLKHSGLCGVYRQDWNNGVPTGCTCGLDDALAALRSQS